jgi:hypothetical protein
MGTQENKATGRRFVEEVVNRGNLAVIDELYGPNYVDQTEGGDGFLRLRTTGA